MVCAKLALLAVAASSVVFAHPFGHRHQQMNKRAIVTVYVTAGVVYVDQNGLTINGPATPTTAPALVNIPASSAIPTSSAVATPSSVSDGILGKSLVYSPYHNDGTCKSAADVSTDLNTVIGTNQAYKGIRLYGVDCQQVENVLPVAKSLGVKVMLGIYDITQAAAEANTLIAGVGSNWDTVHSVAVGNENVNKAILAGQDGATAVANSLAAAASVRALLRAAGFSGPVITPDVFIRFTQFPALCGDASFVAANMHPFFDGSVAAADVSSWYTNQAANVAKACSGKKVLISETGWPTAGDANNQAIPSQPNQDSVISQACSVLKDDVIILGAFNDKWKTNFPGSFNAEQAWGVHGNSPTN